MAIDQIKRKCIELIKSNRFHNDLGICIDQETLPCTQSDEVLELNDATKWNRKRTYSFCGKKDGGKMGEKKKKKGFEFGQKDDGQLVVILITDDKEACIYRNPDNLQFLMAHLLQGCLFLQHLP